MNILYRDSLVVVVDKPSGMLVHRGWGRDKQVLMAAVRDAVGQYVYPVHRLDRGTSGVVAFALSKEAARALSDQFAGEQVGKRYLALVRGVPAATGVIDHPIPRSEGGERVPAITQYRRLQRFGRYAWVEARPRSGRLHQVRRHLKHISCPIIGDVRYGKGNHNRLFRQRYGLHRLALHAFELELVHPGTTERLHVRAPVPTDLREPLLQLAAETGEDPAAFDALLDA